MNTIAQIYVYLLDEGTDVWRPVDAIQVGDATYEIVGGNGDPEVEHWEFATGDLVRCEQRALSGGMHMVAFERSSTKPKN